VRYWQHITEDFTNNTKRLERFTDIVEAFNHLLQWPNKCNLFIKVEDKPAKLLAFKEVSNETMPSMQKDNIQFEDWLLEENITSHYLFVTLVGS
jgi:hypothetical protein